MESYPGCRCVTLTYKIKRLWSRLVCREMWENKLISTASSKKHQRSKLAHAIRCNIKEAENEGGVVVVGGACLEASTSMHNGHVKTTGPTRWEEAVKLLLHESLSFGCYFATLQLKRSFRSHSEWEVKRCSSLNLSAGPAANIVWRLMQ